MVGHESLFLSDTKIAKCVNKAIDNYPHAL